MNTKLLWIIAGIILVITLLVAVVVFQQGAQLKTQVAPPATGAPSPSPQFSDYKETDGGYRPRFPACVTRHPAASSCGDPSTFAVQEFCYNWDGSTQKVVPPPGTARFLAEYSLTSCQTLSALPAPIKVDCEQACGAGIKGICRYGPACKLEGEPGADFAGYCDCDDNPTDQCIVQCLPPTTPGATLWSWQITLPCFASGATCQGVPIGSACTPPDSNKNVEKYGTCSSSVPWNPPPAPPPVPPPAPPPSS